MKKQTSILSKLASSLHRRDEVPNQELAKEIAAKNDATAVQELVEHLHDKRDIQNDCIKVLYEIGELEPALIAVHAEALIPFLDHPNNRLQWGAMTAIGTIALERPQLVFAALPKIMAAADAGSVITRDNAVRILIKLCSLKQYASSSFALLNEQLLHCPTNQLGMYAENAIPIIHDNNRKLFVKTLTARLGDIEKDTQRKRVEKVIRKFS